MDPQETRSKAPSLLTGDAQPAPASKSPERILSGLQGTSARVPGPTRSRRWIWPLALLGVAVAAVILLDVGGVFEPSKPTERPTLTSTSTEAAPTVTEPQNTTAAGNAEPASTSTASAKPATATGTQHENAAVILADQFGPAASASTAATTAPASSASSKDTAALGAMFAPRAAGTPATAVIPAARALRRSDASTGNGSDSDVDLLAVLIKHLEVTDATGKKAHARHGKKATADDDVLPQDCPPANTEAGVACRQRFCAAHAGQGDASCPAASPGGA